MKVTLLETPGNSGVEYWTPLNWNGQIIERYSITSCGRVFDHETNQFRPFRIDKDGYYICDIKLPDGQFKTIRVHRFELMSFNFIPNFKDMVVNHLDGDKTHNELYNLEWTDTQGNTRHGWDTGLNQNFGENHGQSVYNNETIHKICGLLDRGLTNAQICDEFNITGTENRMRFSATVSCIRYGKTHRDISDGYEFRKELLTPRYELEMAHKVCQLLSNSEQLTLKQVMDILEIPNNERIGFKFYITKLFSGYTAKTVTKQYPNMIKPIFTDDLFN